MDTNAQVSAFPRCCDIRHLHGMAELVQAHRYPLNELASGLGQADAACLKFRYSATANV